jgi:hypothetical protein
MVTSNRTTFEASSDEPDALDQRTAVIAMSPIVAATAHGNDDRH